MRISGPVLLTFFAICIPQTARAALSRGCDWTNSGHVVYAGSQPARGGEQGHAARRPPHRHLRARPAALDANGNAARGLVLSHKTGARATVAAAYAPRFQAYVDDLEQNYGARVLFMGGYRPGVCSPRSEHPCGKALDVCQLARGVVDRRCHLPGRALIAQIAARHDLFEGGRWCSSDYGHAQVDVTAAPCGRNRYAFKAPRRHHRRLVRLETAGRAAERAP